MNNRSTKQTISRNDSKLLIFKVIALLLPFVVLLVLEIGLRFFGYGNNLDLFVEDKENANFWVMNPHASERYFSSNENATIGVFESFLKVKSPGTLRIFILGESTTLGFPYMASASFDRWLLYRLMHTFPDRKFEMVNVSLTAVNSYTVLGFAKEIVNFQPDAVLIYCGHNEYYGALGVGSTSQLGGSRLLIQTLLYLRNLRLIQLLENSYASIKKIASGKTVDTRETLMKRMAAEKEIPINSSIYFRGIEQFKNNMNDVCQIISARGIPIFISNLVSNEKDLKPFISSKNDTTFSADYHYTLAQKAYEQDDFTKAKQLFVQSKDLDMLRFRAPEALNAIIATLPQKFPGVYLVDTKKIFEDHSPHRIIGNEILLEHVHPTIGGYGLMSEAFYLGLKQPHLIAPDPHIEIPFDQLRHQMPVTLVDSLRGAYEIKVLKENWPFNQPKTTDFNQMNSFEQKLALSLYYKKTSWTSAMKAQIDYYSKVKDQANLLKVAEASILQMGKNADFIYYVGQLCMEQGQTPKAKVYLQQAFLLSPKSETAQRLTILFLKDDQPEKALPYLTYLLQNNAARTVYSNTISLTESIIEYKNRLTQDSDNVNLINQIAIYYYKMQNTELALQYAEKALSLDKSNAETKELLGKIKPLPFKQ